MIGWGIAFFVLAVLSVVLFAPISAIAEYTEDGLQVWLQMLGLRMTVYPEPEETPEKEKEKAVKKAKKEAKKKKKEQEEQSSAKKGLWSRAKAGAGKLGGNPALLKSLIQPTLALLRELRKKLVVRRVVIHYTIAGKSNPADAAIQYGILCATGGGFLPMLEEALTIRKRDVGACVDFLTDTPTVYLYLDLALNLWKIILLVVHFGADFIRIYRAGQKTAQEE